MQMIGRESGLVFFFFFVFFAGAESENKIVMSLKPLQEPQLFIVYIPQN